MVPAVVIVLIEIKNVLISKLELQVYRTWPNSKFSYYYVKGFIKNSIMPHLSYYAGTVQLLINPSNFFDENVGATTLVPNSLI